MDDLRLHQITLQTTDPAGFERFLCDVLGAEIETINTDEFIAEVCGIRLHVRSGVATQQEWVFTVSSQEGAELAARWEFFCFRNSRVNHPNDVVFSDGHGFTCRIDVERVTSAHENLNISVRNY